MKYFLNEILKNRIEKIDDMTKDHIEEGFVVRNVPCRKEDGIGIVYSSKTMTKVLSLLYYMKDKGIEEIDFNFEFE